MFQPSSLMKLFSEDSDFQVGCGDKWGLSSSCLPCVSVFISRVWSEWGLSSSCLPCVSVFISRVWSEWGLSSSCLPCVSVFISRVWNEWIIENDTFTGMLYTVGEQCGSVDRQAQV